MYTNFMKCLSSPKFPGYRPAEGGNRTSWSCRERKCSSFGIPPVNSFKSLTRRVKELIFVRT